MTARILRRASWRELRRHRVQTLLSVFGVALGVAVLVAVALANESARRAFDLSMDALSGSSTHRIVAVGAGIPEQIYTELRLSGVRPSTPVIEGLVRIRGETFRMIGIEPVSQAAFRSAGSELGQSNLAVLLTRPSTVMMGARDRARMTLTAGDHLPLELRGEVREVELAGELRSDNPVALEGLLVTDIATAQELLDRLGQLDRIELILDEAAAQALATRLPSGLRLETAASDRANQRQMTEAFHTNLTAMGLLAVLVGALLVYNTITFSVLRRRRLFGLLRVLGATRADLFRRIMAESLAIGMIGSALGLLLGVMLGQGLVGLVTRTINDLYFVLTVNSLLVSREVLMMGFVVGLLVTLLAAILPALEAARTTPRAALQRAGLERSAHMLTPWLALLGVILVGLGLLGLLLPGERLSVAFTALFFCVLGFALMVPAALLLMTRLFGPLCQRLFGRTGRLAARGIAAGLSRSGVAVAALTVAVSATVGVGVMVESFRGTVALWLQQTLTSDIYVTLPGSLAERGQDRLAPDLLDRLRTLEGVAAVSTSRAREVDSDLGPVLLLALGDSPQVEPGFRFKTVSATAWPEFRRGDSVFVSESFAYRHDLAVDDRIGLITLTGPVTFKVGGVFFDYSSERGLVVMDRVTYAQHWNDPGVTTAGLDLAPGVVPATVLDQVRALVAAYEHPLLVRANADIRAQSMRIFDRTFAITGVLRLLAVGVAFIGVLSALIALQLDRAREHATLRALGVTPRQLTGLVSIECGLMGLAAGLLALPLGWMMSELLIEVVNRRSFGWSMQSLLPPGVLFEALLLALFAALLSGLYPAWRIATAPPAAALREE